MLFVGAGGGGDVKVGRVRSHLNILNSRYFCVNVFKLLSSEFHFQDAPFLNHLGPEGLFYYIPTLHQGNQYKYCVQGSNIVVSSYAPYPPSIYYLG